MNGDDRDRLLARVRARGPYVQDLSLLGLDVDYYETFRMGSAAVWDLVKRRLPPLTGKTVLDVGCNSGLFGFLAEREGTRAVLGIDADEKYVGQATAIGDLLSSRVRFEVGSVYDLEGRGRFDVVLALGLLYHLRDPFTALDRLASAAGEALVVETEVNSPLLDPHDSVFVLGRYRGDPTNWWLPGVEAIRAALADAGFARVVALPLRDGVYGTPEYTAGFADGFVRHGARWLFAAYRADRPDDEDGERPRFAPRLRAKTPAADDDADAGMVLDVEIGPGDAAAGRLSLYLLDDPSRPAVAWRGEIAASERPRTLRFRIPIGGLADRSYVPVFDLLAATTSAEALDQVVFPVRTVATGRRATNAGLFVQPHRWHVGGKDVVPAARAARVVEVAVLDRDGAPIGTLTPGEPFSIAPAIDGLAGSGAIRSEIALRDAEGRLVTLIDAGRAGIFDTDAEPARLRVALPASPLLPGVYFLSCSVFGTGENGPWAATTTGETILGAAFRVEGNNPGGALLDVSEAGDEELLTDDPVPRRLAAGGVSSAPGTDVGPGRYLLREASGPEDGGRKRTRALHVHAASSVVTGVWAPRVGIFDEASNDLLDVRLLRSDGSPADAFAARETIRVRCRVRNRGGVRPVLEIDILDADLFALALRFDTTRDGVVIRGDGEHAVELAIDDDALPPGAYLLRARLWDHRAAEALSPPALLSLADPIAFTVEGDGAGDWVRATAQEIP
jgi:tRNA (mo5U34)-methyltransferase